MSIYGSDLCPSLQLVGGFRKRKRRGGAESEGTNDGILGLATTPTDDPAVKKIQTKLLENLQKLKGMKANFKDFFTGLEEGIHADSKLVGGAGPIYSDNVPSNWTPGRIKGKNQYFITPDGIAVLVKPRPPPPKSDLDNFLMALDFIASQIPGVNVLVAIGKMIDKAVKGEAVTWQDGLGLALDVVGTLAVFAPGATAAISSAKNVATGILKTAASVVGQTVTKGITAITKGLKVITSATTAAIKQGAQILFKGLAKVRGISTSATAKLNNPNIWSKAFNTFREGLAKAGKFGLSISQKTGKVIGKAVIKKVVPLTKELKTPLTNKLLKVLQKHGFTDATLKGRFTKSVLKSFEKSLGKKLTENIESEFYNSLVPANEKIEEPIEVSSAAKNFEPFEFVDDDGEMGFFTGKQFNERANYYILLQLNALEEGDEYDLDEIIQNAYDLTMEEANTLEPAIDVGEVEATVKSLADASSQVVNTPHFSTPYDSPYSYYATDSQLARLLTNERFVTGSAPSYGWFEPYEQDSIVNKIKNDPNVERVFRDYFNALKSQYGNGIPITQFTKIGRITRDEFYALLKKVYSDYVDEKNIEYKGTVGTGSTNDYTGFDGFDQNSRKMVFQLPSITKVLSHAIEIAETGVSHQAYSDDSELRQIHRTTETARAELLKQYNKLQFFGLDDVNRFIGLDSKQIQLELEFRPVLNRQEAGDRFNEVSPLAIPNVYSFDRTLLSLNRSITNSSSMRPDEVFNGRSVDSILTLFENNLPSTQIGLFTPKEFMDQWFQYFVYLIGGGRIPVGNETKSIQSEDGGAVIKALDWGLNGVLLESATGVPPIYYSSMEDYTKWSETFIQVIPHEAKNREEDFKRQQEELARLEKEIALENEKLREAEANHIPPEEVIEQEVKVLTNEEPAPVQPPVESVPAPVEPAVEPVEPAVEPVPVKPAVETKLDEIDKELESLQVEPNRVETNRYDGLVVLPKVKTRITVEKPVIPKPIKRVNKDLTNEYKITSLLLRKAEQLNQKGDVKKLKKQLRAILENNSHHS